MRNNIEITKNDKFDLHREFLIEKMELERKNRRKRNFFIFLPNIFNSFAFGLVCMYAFLNILNIDFKSSVEKNRIFFQVEMMLICYGSAFIFYLIFNFTKSLFESALIKKEGRAFSNKLFSILILEFISVFFSLLIGQILLNEKIMHELATSKSNLIIDRVEVTLTLIIKNKLYLIIHGGIFIFYFIINYILIRFQISKKRELNELVKNHIKKEQQKSNKINLIDQVEIFSAIQHELANCIPTLINDFNDFIDYLNTNTDFKNELRKPIFEGSNETIEILINTIRKKATRAIATTSDFSEIIKSNPKYFQPESVNLFSFLKQEFNKHADSDISVIYNCNENIFCDIDKLQFSYVIKNLIYNAIRHGFQNSTNKIIEVDLLQEIDSNNDGKVLIRVKNNGKPIKEGFTIEDFKTLYKKSGEFGNTGIGGYNINIILINHGGEIQFNNEIINNSAYTVCFEIKLPLKL